MKKTLLATSNPFSEFDIARSLDCKMIFHEFMIFLIHLVKSCVCLGPFCIGINLFLSCLREISLDVGVRIQLKKYCRKNHIRT